MKLHLISYVLLILMCCIFDSGSRCLFPYPHLMFPGIAIFSVIYSHIIFKHERFLSFLLILGDNNTVPNIASSTTLSIMRDFFHPEPVFLI